MGVPDPVLKPVGSFLYKPDYKRGLAALANSMLSALGYTAESPRLPPDLYCQLEQAERIALLILDGLGSSIFEASRYFGALSSRGFYARISSVFPSTTSSALASLATGLEPAKHGLLGFTILCRKAGGIVRLLRLPQSLAWRGLEPSIISPRDILSSRTIYESLVSEGGRAALVTRRYLADSLLTKALYSGADIVGYAELEDGFLALKKTLESGEYDLVTFYAETYDVVSHIYGPSSEEASLQAERVLGLLLQTVDSYDGPRTKFVATADHGMVWIGGRQYQLSEDKEMMSLLELPPYGDMRAAMLKVRDKERALDILADRGAGLWFDVWSRERVAKESLLGSSELSEEAELRLGDFVLLPGSGSAFDLRFRRAESQTKLLGGHSGLDPEELLVPLLVLDAGTKT